ncbi:hypothetical protein EJ02DRAFT_406725 [Clathrospora elynae]|uniref:Uncharacterized protein n=1 Tax=Clathrospora elynae TaxID=706981 RepID=A0A6A5SKC8_9PLEO|nr:hypothetical protein EJ02DRAFT_406725 [Clathrospora elynae]
MGKNTKKVQEFIESIPDRKLQGLPNSCGTLFKDQDFRLDMQGMTSGSPKNYNLQVQINNETSFTVAKALAPEDESMTPAQIKSTLIDSTSV